MSGFLDLNKILNALPLEEDMAAAEFGCGTGKFTINLARRLPEGKVYGLDIQEKPLAVLEKEARRQSVYNIETIRCNLEEKGGSTLPNRSLDLVLIPNVLFQVEDKDKVLEEAARVLKKGGGLLVVDWRKESSLGPRKEWRLSEEEVKEGAEKKGFELKKEVEAGAFHWALLFTKP